MKVAPTPTKLRIVISGVPLNPVAVPVKEPLPSKAPLNVEAEIIAQQALRAEPTYKLSDVISQNLVSELCHGVRV